MGFGGFFASLTHPNQALRVISVLATGVLLSLAMYSYPPARVQVPLVFAALVAYEMSSATSPNEQQRRHLSLQQSLIALLSLVLVSAPLIQRMLSGELQGRFQMLSVFNDIYVTQFGQPTFGLKTRLFLSSLAQHFSPRFLFLSGDANLRHSTNWGGVWSWLDIFVLASMPLIFIFQRCLKRPWGGA